MPLFETIYHTYKHKWTDISLASWMKYPSPDRPDVLSVDLIEKHFDPETGILTCKRLMICKDNTPAWLKAILGSTEYFFLEEAIVDPKKQTMVLKSQNLNFANILGVEEVCTYTPDPLNDQYTLFKQEATVTASVFGVARKIEAFCLDKFVKNSAKGRMIMEQAIGRVKKEAEESLKDIEETLDKALTTVKKEAEESFKDIEETLDKAISTVATETIGSLSVIEETIDKAIATVKHEAEDSLVMLDIAISSVNKSNKEHNDELLLKLDKSFKSWRMETLDQSGESYPLRSYLCGRSNNNNTRL